MSDETWHDVALPDIAKMIDPPIMERVGEAKP